MKCVIRIIEAADGTLCAESGRYVCDFDVRAHSGLGMFPVTANANEAKAFDTVAAALQFWRTQSRVRPLRPDKKPNRPLTAFTVQFVTLS